ncbi:hypothetical protein KSP35_07480 [Aquihabitans sp. G128]|uniref:hypothetical protein n=1 Tax=Aquihabitans sp. G128 TaxID=2849779 RepID=UPI001C2338EB|nr:hypothetical protein [Aquihabitans sp. G128]QXC62625.1 hypothetical protein KSP35_07480 [Aquihabitans sp. G128]
MFKLLFLPFRLAIGFLKLSGVKGSLLLLLGVGIGLLIAPQKGERLRAQLLAKLADARAGAAGVPADQDLSL